MNINSLIPAPDTVPAPPWIFDLLGLLLFLVHILLVNLVMGGALIALFSPIRRSGARAIPMSDAVSRKLPLFFPFAITLGVAPLLFVQVVYGHFFYASSVLMASWWIAVVPLLIVAYYGLYVFYRRMDSSPVLARVSLTVSALFLLYIGFAYVNNFTLMNEPERWVDYFQNRSGTLLNLHDPTLVPRYLHFVSASVAIASLFMAALWSRRSAKVKDESSLPVGKSLKVFGVATAVQILVGLWFLTALPRPVVGHFLGGDVLKTAILLVGALAGVGAAVSAFDGKLRPTMVQTVVALLCMAVTRYNVRSLYLEPYFTPSQLNISPQYGVFALFLLVLLVGIASVAYMVKISSGRTIHLDEAATEDSPGTHGGAQ